MQRVLHLRRKVRSGERDLCALLSERSAGADLRLRSRLARPFRHRDRLYRRCVTCGDNMFSVLFEVHPKAEHWDTYLGVAKMLRPEIERIDGFIDNIRYKSLTREGWIFSLSSWRDEKALVRWRTQSKHHAAQDRGRTEILSDYHLRVGEIVHDSGLPDGEALREQRLDETAAGKATTVTLIDTRRAA